MAPAFAIPSKRAADIDAIAHKIAVTLLDDVAEMNADTELDAAILDDAGVSFDHSILHFDGAPNRIDNAAKLDQRPVTGALEDTSVVHGDGRVNEIAAQSAEPRQGAILVRAGEPTETDHVGGENCREFAFFRHRSLSGVQSSTTTTPMRTRCRA